MSSYFGNALPPNLASSNELFGAAAAAAAVTNAMTANSSMLISNMSPQAQQTNNINTNSLSQQQQQQQQPLSHETIHSNIQNQRIQPNNSLQMCSIPFLNGTLNEQLNNNPNLHNHHLQANSYENGFNNRFYDRIPHSKTEQSSNYQNAINGFNITSPIQQNHAQNSISSTSATASSNIMCSSSNSNSSQFASTSSSSSPENSYMNLYKLGAGDSSLHLSNQNQQLLHSQSHLQHQQHTQQIQSHHQLPSNNHIQTPTSIHNMTPHHSFNSAVNMQQNGLNMSMNQMAPPMNNVFYPWMRPSTNIKSSKLLKIIVVKTRL